MFGGCLVEVEAGLPVEDTEDADNNDDSEQKANADIGNEGLAVTSLSGRYKYVMCAGYFILKKILLLYSFGQRKSDRWGIIPKLRTQKNLALS